MESLYYTHPQPGSPVQEREKLVASGSEHQEEFCLSVSVRWRLVRGPGALPWCVCMSLVACHTLDIPETYGEVFPY